MQTVLAPQEQQKQRAMLNCTQHRSKAQPGKPLFHIMYADISDVCDDNVSEAHAMRAFEWSTDQRIEKLRSDHGIPMTHMPAEDDLWLPMPYRAIEALTLHSVSRSSCTNLLESLIQRGYIRRRIIARPGDGVIATRPTTTTVYRDADGEFIVVDEHEEYIGYDGKRHHAVDDGFTLPNCPWQYLYDFDAVNKAIAEYDGYDAPEPLPRWEPTIARWEPQGRPRRQKKSAAAAQETTTSPSVSAASDAPKNRSTRRDTSSFDAKCNTNSSALSLLRDTLDLDVVRVQQWSAGTLLGLLSFFLDIPVLPENDDEAMDRWARDWGEPIKSLFAMTSTLSPQLAWERIDIISRYMGTPGSPSWWQREPGDPRGWRKTRSPITARNIADHYHDQYEDFKANSWFPSEATPYDGPQPVESGYYGGYVGEESTVVVEADPPPPGAIVEAVVEDYDDKAFAMAPEELNELTAEISAAHPELIMSILPAGDGKEYLGIQVSDTEWLDVDSVVWAAPQPAQAALIDQAIHYGAQVAAEQQREQGEAPPDEESEETAT